MALIESFFSINILEITSQTYNESWKQSPILQLSLAFILILGAENNRITIFQF